MLRAAESRLRAAGLDDPAEDALLLVGLLLDRRRGQLLLARSEAVDAATSQRFDLWIERRAAREPVQHIAGEQEFHGLSFRVTPAVLIPRPETEMLVDAVVEATPQRAFVVDLGTGSGCIAVAAAVARGDLTFGAVDSSPGALDVARFNARRHGVEDCIAFVEGDLAAPPASWHARASTVVSNPPYVTEADWAGLQPEVRDHDPKAALVPGPTGLEAYRVLIPAASRLLQPDGVLLVELGAGQADAVRDLVMGAGFEAVEIFDDLNGIARLLQAHRGC